MKRMLITLTIATLGFAAVPASANNWQWQLDQIKADQQRRAKCHAAEQAKQLSEKMSDAQKKAEARKNDRPTPIQPAK